METLSRLADAGFLWQVSRLFVAEMPYAAALDCPDNYYRAGVYLPDGKPLFYGGDIPDFALDRIPSAHNLGAKTFTIHSCVSFPIEPLPSTTQSFFLTIIDAVLIAWPALLTIIVDQHRPYIAPDSYHIGTIIAAWEANQTLHTMTEITVEDALKRLT
jgi:hypothetical protein